MGIDPQHLDAVPPFRARRPDAVFSMGGYVAGPPVLAAVLRGIPLVVMEPNAVPGFTNRHIARWVKRALVSFEETERYFPPGRAEVTGRPVREEFFAIPAKPPEAVFTVLITGGSQGSRTLNNAARESWPRVQVRGMPVRLIHQTGTAMFDELKSDWDAAGLDGEISAVHRRHAGGLRAGGPDRLPLGRDGFRDCGGG